MAGRMALVGKRVRVCFWAAAVVAFSSLDASATPLGRWVPGGSTTGGLVGGYQNSNEPDRKGRYDLPICRAHYNGGIHPGKVWRDACHFEWGGKEFYTSVYEVLVDVPASSHGWVQPVDRPYPSNPLIVNAQTPPNAVDAGVEGGVPLPICRAFYNNGLHPGKWWKGQCHIGWAGKGRRIDAVHSWVLVAFR